jgi:SAM-dependent methyltransferase
VTAAYFERAYGAAYAARNPPYKWRAFLREVARFRRGGTLLEAGCGYGLFLNVAASRFDCVGCDVSEHAIRTARRSVPDGVPLLVASLETLFLRRRFDVVAAFDALEHVADLPAALDRLGALVRPGGLLVFTVPVYDGPLGWLVGRLDRDDTHVHRRSRDFWLDRIGAGFRLRRYVGVWRCVLPGGIYLTAASRLSRRVATAILVIAERAAEAPAGRPAA